MTAPDSASSEAFTFVSGLADLVATETAELVLLDFGTDADDPVGWTHHATAELLGVLQRFLADPAFERTRLAVVTRNAVTVGQGDACPDPGPAALWGMTRVAQTEHPDRIVLIDHDGRDVSWDRLLSAAMSDEPQLAIRNGTLHAARLEREPDPLPLPLPEGPWRLEVTDPGTLDNLAITAVAPSETPLEPGRVRVAVRAAGLNFRDVLIALGMYPGRASIGGEAAGMVVQTAPDVTTVAVGDRVMGLFDGAIGPEAVTDHRLTVRIPDGWTFVQAATTPIAFLTAYYALRHLADLRPDERILIHAAAGGVGMAAVQLATHFRAEIFGTAHPGKWNALRGLGLDDAHLASSRTLDFEERFRAGVDVVLNSLAGEYVDASLRLLSPGGRFLELGKTDIRHPGEHPGLRYQAFDLAEVPPEQIQRMLTELLGLFERGALTPLPVTTFDVRHAIDAFRHLQQTRHIGKVAMIIPRPLDPDGTVLITGGTGALGAHAARHLAREHGVRHFVVASRRGPDAPGAGELRGIDAHVTVVACDVADRRAVAGLLADIPAEHPLTAVIHTAGVLDDATLGAMTTEQVHTVLRPKVDAAWHLHTLTKDLDLAAFILYSSAAGVLGNPGQANYAAANTFLDTLAAHRHALGLAATSLAWGLWDAPDSGGMTGALDDADLARIERAGMLPLEPAAGMELFERALSTPGPVLVPARFSLPALRRMAAADLLPPLLSGLAGRRSAPPPSASRATLDISGQSDADATRVVLDLLRRNIAAVLGGDPADPGDPGRPFKDQGFDSLTAVELRNVLIKATGLRLPATLLFDYPTPRELATELVNRLRGEPIRGPAAVRTAANDEPIAIVGMSCRFPGGIASPDDLWTVAAEGIDTIGSSPPGRGWSLDDLYDPEPGLPGRTYVRTGGFMTDAEGFDAEFFGISPREAEAMDPQQRLLLEIAWEAVENARIRQSSMRGTPVGVFVGVAAQEYGGAAVAAHEAVAGYVLTGRTTSVASGRIAYALGLEGPALTVDTACSSSLVAIHLAAQSLRNGECTLALAGGTTVMASPGIFLEFARQRGLAPDGRCKPFAAAADGTGWGEGAGLILLERLSDAQANGHPILAVIRGSAVNQDGASNGLTAPNGPSQQRVITAALASARLRPEDVDTVEAHGTGTTLGDPIEAEALIATYGRRPPEQPLWLGSIKSNIGHTQAAAGAAGVIKMVQALRHRVLPRSLHIDAASPHVDWSAGTVRLLSDTIDWPDTGRPRRAAVSSFGISGTNAHLILEQAPSPAPSASPARTPSALPLPLPLPLSAKSEGALIRQARRAVQRLDADPLDLAFSYATTRDHLSHRAVIVGGDREELRSGLLALAEGHSWPGLVTGVAGPLGKVAFVFPGQGSQWDGMARELLHSSAVFRDSMHACADALEPHLGWRLLDVLTGASDAPGTDRVDIVQPTLFALMVSLARLWIAAGVRPDAVVGHSQGEIAAAHIAGALSLRDAARVVATRSRALIALAGSGAMASVPLPADQVAARLARFGGDLAVAARNGPAATVVSGAPPDVAGFVQACRDSGVRARAIAVDYASHSSHVEAIKDRLLADLDGLAPEPADIPLCSTLTGGFLDTTLMTADYWYENLRRPVQFEQAVRALAETGHTGFVEPSPHPVLTLPTQEILEGKGTVIGTLRRDEGGRRRFLTSLAQAHTAGIPVDWERLLDGGQCVDLPTYPFEHRPYWLRAAGTGSPGDVGLGMTGHALLGAGTVLPDGARLLTGRLSIEDRSWLADHTVRGAVLLPGAAFVDIALHAAGLAGCDRVEELTLEAPLVLPERGTTHVQALVGAPDEDGKCSFTLHSRPAEGGDDSPWTRHATGLLTGSSPSQAEATAAWPPPSATPLPVDDLYASLADLGLAYGPAFQGVHAAWSDADAVYAEVALEEHTDVAGHVIHPALLDAALHVAAFRPHGADTIRLPFTWHGISIVTPGQRRLRVRLTTERADTVSLQLHDESGRYVGEVAGLVLRPVPGELLSSLRTRDSLMRMEWAAAPAPQASGGPWAVAGDPRLAAILDAEHTDLHDPATAGANPADRARSLLVRTLAAIQSFLADEDAADRQLIVVTRDGVATDDDDPVDPASAALWGLLRTAQLEHPGRLVLLDLDGTDASYAAAAEALACGEEQLALRSGTATVPRLTRAESEPPADGRWPEDGTTLITGGTGVLAGLLARHLVRTYGARHLLLAGRRGALAEGATQLANELGELGANVTVAACDVTDPAALSALIEQIPPGRPLRAVIHAAGVLDDATVTSLTPEHLDAVLRPKANAAWNLHQLTRDIPLKAFVLYSSAAGVLGAPGQANYAAANAFLDGLAHHRQALGLPVTSVAWGLWEHTSALTAGADAAKLARGGLGAMPTEQAHLLLDTALASGLPVLVAAHLNWPALRKRATTGTLPGVLRGIVRTPARRPATDGAGLREQLLALDEPGRRRLLTKTVLAAIAGVLGHAAPQAIPADRPFLDLGFDSLTAVEFRNHLAAITGLRLPASLVFDRPNAAAVAEHLLTQLVTTDGDRSDVILAELERIEEAMLELAADDATHTRLTDRLERLLARWRRDTGQVEEETAVGERIETASVEEVLDFIDQELGRSRS
ncbi:MAG TPA: SDR family NAD(P)-dependent oxidoreductase [Nonomuraea sp.]|nr:SDR family NAD(P)-dependent oxidoreductase [Nonomuraea sp.]